VLHIVSHGDDAGVLLSGDSLSKERLGQIARHVRADLVFLNACNSAALGQYLACAGVPCVVCYTVAVADQDALRSASYFYEELDACGGDYKKAFDKVNPCDGSFAWFAGANYVDAAVAPLVSGVEAMRSSLVRMQQIVYVALATLGVLLVAAAAALVVFASGVAAQGESPLPTPTPVGQSPLDNPPSSGGGNTDDHEIAPIPHELPVWATSTPLPTETPTPTDTPTAIPTPSPTHTPALPTLTPDYMATLTALPPCE
jgi:hypothetical protein